MCDSSGPIVPGSDTTISEQAVVVAESSAKEQERLKKITDAVRTILECVGENPDREGLLKTPERYAKALMFFTAGYRNRIQGTLAALRRSLLCADGCAHAHGGCVRLVGDDATADVLNDAVFEVPLAGEK